MDDTIQTYSPTMSEPTDPVGVTKFDVLSIAPVDNTSDRHRYIIASDGRPRERADAIITMTGPIVVGVALSCAMGYAAWVSQGVSPSYPSTATELNALSVFLLTPQPNPPRPT